MPIPKPERKIIYINDTAPVNSEYVAWVDTTTRTIKVFEGGQWVMKVNFADTMELPEKLKLTTLVVEKEAQFNNVIKVGDYTGQTAEIKTESGVLVFKNGLLVKYG
jgi:hypothetical protein